MTLDCDDPGAFDALGPTLARAVFPPNCDGLLRLALPVVGWGALVMAGVEGEAVGGGRVRHGPSAAALVSDQAQELGLQDGISDETSADAPFLKLVIGGAQVSVLAGGMTAVLHREEVDKPPAVDRHGAPGRRGDQLDRLPQPRHT